MPLVFETTLMVLALYKAKQLWVESGGFTGLKLVKILIRDQVIYFAGYAFLQIGSICCANGNFSVVLITSFKILEFNIQPIIPDLIFTTLGNTNLLSIFGSRMLFNMKEAGDRGVNAGMSLAFPTLQIDFAAARAKETEQSVSCHELGKMEAQYDQEGRAI